MRTNITNRYFLISFVLAAFMLLSVTGFAQQKTDTKEKGKKTITIHVTKEVDGDVVVIDTTVITDGDFDADAFLAEKGIETNIPDGKKQIEKNVIIHQPGTKTYTWSDSDGNLPDTIKLDNSEMYVFTDKFEIETPSAPDIEGMPFHYYKFNRPVEMPYFDHHQVENMIEGMARAFGLGDVMPFGEMKQMVVKKKRNGKKVIITFEDRDEASRKNAKTEEKVIILKNPDQAGAPGSEDHIIIKGNPGEKIIINEDFDTETNEKRITVDVETDNATPVKTEKKVIIIKEEKKK